MQKITEKSQEGKALRITGSYIRYKNLYEKWNVRKMVCYGFLSPMHSFFTIEGVGIGLKKFVQNAQMNKKESTR